ncbi:DUF4190 domain-containing protein [Leifsonia sp. L25]|uniref:DUF4190 domain-containing protein n=1 Tax=Leifsonia TaxID=110932 RepID=UPI003D672A4A
MPDQIEDATEAPVETAQPTPATPLAVPAPTADRMNVLAIVAFVLSFFVGIVGIVCGHIALRQIKRTGDRGRGLALAGTILGYVFTAFGLFIAVVVVPVLIMAAVDAAEYAGY